MDRRVALGLLIYLFFLAGLVLLNGALLALALPLLVYLGAGVLWAPGELHFDVERRLPEARLTDGEALVVRLTITNRGGRIEEALAEDEAPPHLELVAGQRRQRVSLDVGETLHMSYTLRARRGVYHFPGVQVTVRDALGVVTRRQVVAAPGQVTVLPRMARLRRVAIRPTQTRVYAGQIPAHQGGAGIAFFGVRGYQHGDPLRWINWKASARHAQQLFTTEFEQERVADVGLILDARRRNDLRHGGDSLFEHTVMAAAALADAFINQGNRVGLLLYGDYLDWTFPGYGKIQRERIMQALARARSGESMIFENLENLPARLFPAHAQLVLISPLLRGDLRTLLHLRARGYQVLVVSPDPIAYELKALPPGPEVTLAGRIATLERRVLLRALLGAGIRVLDWQVEVPFDQAVHASLSRLPPGFSGYRPRG